MEALSGLLLGQALDEDGAKGLVLAVGGTRGSQEEVTRQGVVHGTGAVC
jgi:hypothetical protein